MPKGNFNQERSGNQGGGSNRGGQGGGSNRGGQGGKGGGSNRGGQGGKGGGSKGSGNRQEAVDRASNWQDAQTGQTQTKGGVRQFTQPDYTSLIEGLVAISQQDYNETYAQNRERTAINLANADNQTRLGLGNLNLQGVLAQSEAAKFAASEAARGSIETQRVASQSQERQIGLTGLETRATNEQLEMFRRYKEQQDYSQARAAFHS
jgi:hypothetical protein